MNDLLHDTQTHAKSYKEGLKAGRKSAQSSIDIDNPYRKNSQMYLLWQQGFMSGIEQYLLHTEPGRRHIRL